MRLRNPSQGHGRPHSPLFKILLAWVVALALASGHHAFYASLNNRAVASSDVTTNVSLLTHSQAGALAIGTTFAFLVSALLGISTGTAFLQCAWRLVGQRTFTLSGLNALWSSQSDAFAFLAFDFWRSARGVVLISALPWAFPLVVTFAPSTLIVENRINIAAEACKVPTFDFRSSALLHDEENSVENPYLRPSSTAMRVVGATLLGHQPFSPTPPCSGNCSYLVSVNAPSFACSAGARNASALNWPIVNPSFNPPPYFATNLDVTPSINQYNGWDFEAHYSDYSSFHPASDGTNVTCVAYNSTYHLNYTFAGTTRSVTIDQIVQQQPASQLSPNTANGDFIPDSYIHSAWFNATTNYYAVLSSMYTYLVGNITIALSADSSNFIYTPSSISLPETPLIDTEASYISNGTITWSSHPDFPSAMKSLLQNITLSILTGSLDASQMAATTCGFTKTLPHFAYDAWRLWLIYGLGLGIALLCDLVGLLALWLNAFGAEGSFSDFLTATRNEELNGLDFTKPDRIKLRYGLVRSEGGRYVFARPESLHDSTELDGGTDKETPFLPVKLEEDGR
ncbi:hypothetical protein DFH09DRAFT_1321820 [Mycena vulgaris]|nr:hypothetical protein DFH09DRAFT_1321820 [Mycena vulgaris]